MYITFLCIALFYDEASIYEKFIRLMNEEVSSNYDFFNAAQIVNPIDDRGLDLIFAIGNEIRNFFDPRFFYRIK